MTTSSQSMSSAVSSSATTTIHQVKQNGYDHKSTVVGKAGRITSLFFQAIGAGALVVLEVANPTISSALSAVFAKVASVFPKIASVVAFNSTAIAGGAIAVGALNILDGLISIYKGGQNSANLSVRDNGLPESARGSKTFSKLISLYASIQRRGALQTLAGAAALAVGALALAGAVFNPYGLVVAGAVAVVVLVGVQIQKVVISRRIEVEQEKYNAIYPTAS